MQLDLFNDFKPAPIEPPLSGELVIFPLRQSRMMVLRLAGLLRSIQDLSERDRVFHTRLRELFRMRIADGLTREAAVSDIRGFEAAVRAEYVRPTSLPPLYPDHDSLVPFPSFEDQNHDRQTA
ncbi:hypothetical protein EHE22_03665 [Ochrobactrum pseudogrignonense]|uniref:Uncharacterized protein n=1 Tax=Brucella pseudogrignonensis TaxID=419475 RepID=A0A7Y3WVS6_9HYPH|nr:DUF6074 family protein [Brucella pseudogrignonensis]NNV19527.1 hypothetical protein [Brucella pseudogrignonensis]